MNMSEKKVIKNGSKRIIGEWDEEMCTARRVSQHILVIGREVVK
jgi:hypothetical protein